MIDTTTETCRSYLSNHIHFFSYLPSTLCIYTPPPQETVYEWLQSLNSCSYNKDKDYFFLRLFSQIAAHEKHRKGCICCRVVYKSDFFSLKSYWTMIMLPNSMNMHSYRKLMSWDRLINRKEWGFCSNLNTRTLFIHLCDLCLWIVSCAVLASEPWGLWPPWRIKNK